MAVQRLTGLASGMDYESIISKLMKAESAPIDKLKQQKQIREWQQEAFRDINTNLLALKTSALDMKLSSAYKVFNTTSSDTGTVSVTGTVAAVEGTYKIRVNQLATTSQKDSAATVSPVLQSTQNIDFTSPIDMSGKDFFVTFDGAQKHISWSAGETPYNNITELKAGIQAKIDNVVGANQITVSNIGDKIVFSPTDTTFKTNITLNTGTTSDALASLNFADYARSQISLDTQLKDIKFASGVNLQFDASDKLNFSINGSSFSINKTDTLQTLFSTVNSDPNADVTMGYDTSKDKIYIKRKSSGAGKDINFVEDGINGNFAAAVGFAATVLGQNSKVDFTDSSGVTTSNIEKTSNNITIAGLNITLLNADTTTDKTITVSKDVNSVYDKIKAYIDKYNDTIDKLNTKTSEEKDYDYSPLTDEQREAMTEDQITAWEAKAKSGLVNGDTILEGIARNLRYSITGEVVGLNSSFNQISEFGISTGGYQDNGKLYIDETKLKQIISEHPDEVMNFFAANPSDLKGNILNGTVDVDNKDFKISMNGITETIQLSGSYDLSTSTGKADFIKQINDKLQTAFGYSSLAASLSSDNRVIFSSTSGSSFTLNSGPTNDALDSIGFADGSNYNSAGKGIMSKIYDNLSTGIKMITEKAGSSTSFYDTSLISEQINSLSTRITEANDRLTQIEDRYYAQFTAMEAALQKMNSQSSWLSQQFGAS